MTVLRVSQYCWISLMLVHILMITCEGNQQGRFNYRREHIIPPSNFALLSGTLKTFQKAACDDEQVTLKCPRGTRIALDIVRYDRTKESQSKELCPTTGNTEVVKRSRRQNNTCSDLRVLENVAEICQKKQQCKFTKPPDPCPGFRSYVEIAYKCRPYEFPSKTACENEVIHLTCNPYSRLAILSANYGRTEYESTQCPQPQGVPEENCQVSYATETVMGICHGKRRCTIPADASTFGNPCRPESKMYLKVVFTCVPLNVLKKKYEVPNEEDELNPINNDTENDGEDDDFDGYDTGDELGESAASPASPSSPNADGTQRDNNNLNKDTDGSTSSPLSKGSQNSENALEKSSIYTSPRNRKKYFRPSRPTGAPSFHTTKDMQDDDISDEKSPELNCTVSAKTTVIGFITEWINAYTFITQNLEKLYLYLILGVTAGVVLCLGLVIGQLLVQRHRAHQDAKFHQQSVTEQTLPNGFTDDIYRVDADIDLTTPLPIPTVSVHSPPRQDTEVVRYGVSSPTPIHSTIRRYDVDCEAAQPRSLNRAGNSQYYYG